MAFTKPLDPINLDETPIETHPGVYGVGVKITRDGIIGYDPSIVGRISFQISADWFAQFYELQTSNGLNRFKQLPTGGLALETYRSVADTAPISAIWMPNDLPSNAMSLLCDSLRILPFNQSGAPVVYISPDGTDFNCDIRLFSVSDAPAQNETPLVLDPDSASVRKWTNAPQRPILGSGTLASGTVIAAGSFATISCPLNETASTAPRWADVRRSNNPSGSGYLNLEFAAVNTTTVTVRAYNTTTASVTLGSALFVAVAAFI